MIFGMRSKIPFCIFLLLAEVYMRVLSYNAKKQARIFLDENNPIKLIVKSKSSALIFFELP
jgi:hypothetical protein